MHIQKFIIKNFRCFEHLEVNLDPDINIFVGNNGSGKSALLDGIAAAMYPYVVQTQNIVDKEYEDKSPVLQRDLPAKLEINKHIIQAELNISATGLPNWTIIYEKPPSDDDNAVIRVYDAYRSISLQDGLKKIFSAIEKKCDHLKKKSKI